ncbi:hypothetical protein HDU93_005842, partial [Gonapodya sp. JEL0774]
MSNTINSHLQLSLDSHSPSQITSDILSFWFPNHTPQNFFTYLAKPEPSVIGSRETAIPGEWVDIWFRRGSKLDPEVREKFAKVWEEVLKGEKEGGKGEEFMKEAEKSVEGTVACVVLLDQFPRHIHRSTAAAFASDHLALRLTKRSLENGNYDRACFAMRFFMRMPLMHSEHLSDGELGLSILRNELALLPDPAASHPAFGIVQASIKSFEEHLEVVRKFG